MIKEEQGITMILTVFIIAILLTLIYSFTTIIRTNNNNLAFLTKTTKAFYGAEAGVETALTYLNQVEVDLSKENNINCQLDKVKYKVKINKGGIYKYKIKSKGHYQGISKTIIAHLEEIDNDSDGKSDGLIIASWREF